MGHQGPAAEVVDEGGDVEHVAGDDLRAVGGAEPVPGHAERDRAVREVGDRALLRLHLDRLLDRAPRQHLVPLLVEALDHRSQLELVRGVAQLRPVGRLAKLVPDRDRHLDVVDHRRQPLRDPRVLGVLGQVLLALRAGDLVDVREHLLERPEALEELGGGLVADPRDSRDVVGGVALEPDEVGDELGRDPVALDHPVAVIDLRVGDPARRGHHPDPVADQLVDVAVAGDDHHRDPCRRGIPGHRRDHVVGLIALDRDVLEAERLGQRRQVRPLLLEQVRARLALRLVLGVDVLSARPALVPGDDHRPRAEVDQQLGHHRRESVDRIRRPPVSGRDRLGQGEERPVGERVPVDQEQLPVLRLGDLLGHALIL